MVEKANAAGGNDNVACICPVHRITAPSRRQAFPHERERRCKVRDSLGDQAGLNR
jgi:hypothetical protein